MGKKGKVADFGKCETLIYKESGERKHAPNPFFGALCKGPFYAVKIHPGDCSTTVGLRIDPQCRVTDANGDPFEGLYAAGLDANSIWRGKSPAHGCNVGPAMVLGYIAGKSLAEARTRA